MFYEAMGRIHATLLNFRSGERGQGTVEYVGLILLVGVILAGVVKATNGFSDKTVAKAIVEKLKSAIGSVGG